MTTKEIKLEKAEGDLLERRRKCERILGLTIDDAVNLSEGDETHYASLKVRVGSDHLVIHDVDGKTYALISLNDLPDEPPHNIEELQERLDKLHFESLSEL